VSSLSTGTTSSMPSEVGSGGSPRAEGWTLRVNTVRRSDQPNVVVPSQHLVCESASSKDLGGPRRSRRRTF
jgi:hypothetical protein